MADDDSNSRKRKTASEIYSKAKRFASSALLYENKEGGGGGDEGGGNEGGTDSVTKDYIFDQVDWTEHYAVVNFLQRAIVAFGPMQFFGTIAVTLGRTLRRHHGAYPDVSDRRFRFEIAEEIELTNDEYQALYHYGWVDYDLSTWNSETSRLTAHISGKLKEIWDECHELKNWKMRFILLQTRRNDNHCIVCHLEMDIAY